MYVLMYAEHNYHFLAAAAMMDGDFDKAYRAAKDLESMANVTVTEMAGAEGYLPTPYFVLLRYGRWDEVLTLHEPEAKLKGLTFAWRYARACAFAAKGDAAKAEAERNAMEEEYKQIPAGPAFGMLFNDWGTIHDLASNTLDARIAAARGDLPGAIEHWRAAVAVQDKSNYNEPPDWYYPVRESLGAALLRNGHAAEAEAVFREDLRRNPRNPRSLFGLWKSLDAQKRTVDADWVKASFGAAWKGSPDGPRLADF
jgi:tetratricopeptide (TPR) repeat protein